MEGMKREGSSRDGSLSYVLALEAPYKIDRATWDARNRTRVRKTSHGADGTNTSAQEMAPVKETSNGPDGPNLSAQETAAISETSNGVDGPNMSAQETAPVKDGPNLSAQETDPISETSNGEDGPNSSAQNTAPIAVALNGRGFFMDIITINAGEDLRKKILSYLQVREKFPSYFQGYACLSQIFSGIGDVSKPKLSIQGSEVSYEESLTLIVIKGFYSVDKNGHSRETSKMSITVANSNGDVFGGDVIGALIAGIPIQVTMGTFIVD